MNHKCNVLQDVCGIIHGLCVVLVVSGVIGALPVMADALPVVPGSAVTWEQLTRQEGLPAHSVAGSGALVQGWEGVGVLDFEPVAEIPLMVRVSARGEYRVSLGCITGGSYPALEVWVEDALVATAPAGGAAMPRVLQFVATATLPSKIMLSLRPVGGGPSAVFMTDCALLSYEPVPSDVWRFASITGDDLTKLPAELAGEHEVGYPGSMHWQATVPDRDVAAGHGLLVAVVHFHDPNPFTGYGFRLQASAPAALFVNGKLTASVAAGETVTPKVTPWNLLGKIGLTRLVVVMKSGNTGPFELSASPLHGARFLDHVPAQFTPLAEQPEPQWQTVSITNGLVSMAMPLPDVEHGFYRGTRFEAAGQATSLTAFGHEFAASFGEPHNPLLNDHAAGTAEAFFEPLGYEEAEPGQAFIKLGVGLLERPSSSNFFFGSAYRVLELYPWTQEIGQDRATFRQTVEGPRGWGYDYEKRLILPEGKAELRIEHTLTNTGTKRLLTNQYAHNFIRIDGKPTGPDHRVTFGFNARPVRDLSALKRKANSFTPTGKTFFSPLNGCLTAAQNRVTIGLVDDGPSVTIGGDFAPSRFWFFGNDRATCPEPFVRIDLAPGESMKWTRTYTFSQGRTQ